MPDQRSVMKEFRFLDEKRLAEGLTPAEAARLDQLRELMGPEMGAGSLRGGFDVNAAAARLRDSLLPAGLRNRPPPPPPEPAPEPPPQVTPLEEPPDVEAPAPEYADPYAAPEGGLAEGALFDPASLDDSVAVGTDPYAAASFDLDASQANAAYEAGAEPPLDPNAPYDPNAQAAWDPNAAYEAGAEPALDPNAPYDPNAQAAWDPNAAYEAGADPALDPGVPFLEAGAEPGLDGTGPSVPPVELASDPSAPYDGGADPALDPNVPYDPGAQAAWDPSAAYEAGAEGALDPNVPPADAGVEPGLDPLEAPLGTFSEATDTAAEPEGAEATWAEPEAALDAAGLDPSDAAEPELAEAAAQADLSHGDPGAAPAAWDAAAPADPLMAEPELAAEPDAALEPLEAAAESPPETAPDAMGSYDAAAWDSGTIAADGAFGEPLADPGAEGGAPLEAAPLAPFEEEAAALPPAGWDAEPEPLAPAQAAPLGEYDESDPVASIPEDAGIEGALPPDPTAATASDELGEVPEGFGTELGEYDDTAGFAATYGEAAPAAPGEDAPGFEEAPPAADPEAVSWAPEAVLADDFQLESGGSFGLASQDPPSPADAPLPWEVPAGDLLPGSGDGTEGAATDAPPFGAEAAPPDALVAEGADAAALDAGSWEVAGAGSEAPLGSEQVARETFAVDVDAPLFEDDAPAPLDFSTAPDGEGALADPLAPDLAAAAPASELDVAPSLLDFSRPDFSAADVGAEESAAPPPSAAEEPAFAAGVDALPAPGEESGAERIPALAEAPTVEAGAPLAPEVDAPAPDAALGLGLADDDIPTIDGEEILEEIPLEEEAPPANSTCRVPGTHRVVVHTVEGQVKRGVLEDAALDAPSLALTGHPGQAVEEVATEKVKAIFFMLAPGEKAPAPEGKKVRVTFRDGRQVAGFGPDYREDGPGFFMIPGDTRTNTGRIWVYRAAVRQVVVS